MSDVLHKWVEKAEEDWHAAAALRAADMPLDGSVCFHLQQCVEKLLKAALVARGVTPPKIHDLRMLDRLLRALEPRWQANPDDLRRLTLSAVAARYPGEDVDDADAAWAVAFVGPVRTALLALMPSATDG